MADDRMTISTYRAGIREFVASNECFPGTIDEKAFRRIDLHPVDAHPGLPRYRMTEA